MRILFRLAAALMLTTLLGACAQGARTNAMVAPVQSATILPADSPLTSRISVGSVTGGEETNPIWTSEVSSAAFKAALEQSLKLNTMLADGTGPLIVNADLVSIDQPLIGIGMTVTSVVAYTVKNSAGQSVYSETISTPYTANFSDAFLGSERLRLANEGSVKANISSFIEKLVTAANTDPATFRSAPVS